MKINKCKNEKMGKFQRRSECANEKPDTHIQMKFRWEIFNYKLNGNRLLQLWMHKKMWMCRLSNGYRKSRVNLHSDFPHFPRNVIVIPLLYHSTICKRFTIHTHTHWIITSFRTRCKTLDTRQWKKMYFNPATIPSILSRGRMRSGWQMKRICDDIEKW